MKIMTDLIWISGKRKEVIWYNKPLPVSMWKAKILKGTTHRTGQLCITKNGTDFKQVIKCI